MGNIFNLSIMKFLAVLALVSTAATAEVADGGDCSVKDATCVAASCCGTVTAAKEAKGPATTVCAKKPTDAEIKADAKGTVYIITAEVAKTDSAAAVPAVTGPFLCTAAAADAAGASYMTVGAAAVIAAAALL